MNWDISALVFTALLGGAGLYITLYPPTDSGHKKWLAALAALTFASLFASGWALHKSQIAEEAWRSSQTVYAVGGDNPPVIEFKPISGDQFNRRELFLANRGSHPLIDVEAVVTEYAGRGGGAHVLYHGICPILYPGDDSKVDLGVVVGPAEYWSVMHTRRGFFAEWTTVRGYIGPNVATIEVLNLGNPNTAKYPVIMETE